MSHGMIIHNPKFHPNRANHCKTAEKAKIWQPWPPKIKFAICLFMARRIITHSFVQIELTIAELQKSKYMATLSSKIKFAICLFMARRIITQSFVQIRLTVAELQHWETYGNPEQKNSGHCARSRDHRTYHAKFRQNPSSHFGMHSRTYIHTYIPYIRSKDFIGRDHVFW